jgi:Ribosomal protein L7/L12 C-terminal domain
MLEILVAVVAALSLYVLILSGRVKTLEANVRRLLAGKQNPMFTPAPANQGLSAVSAAAVSSRPAVVAPVAAAIAGASPNAPPLAEIERLIRENQLIGAIKLWREATGVGLKDAKDAVEAVRDEMKRRG